MLPHGVCRVTLARIPAILLRIMIAIVLLIASGLMLYGAWTLFSEEILPLWQQGQWKIASTSMVLNRTWEGNQLYVLVGIYIGMAFAGVLLCWRLCRGVRLALQLSDSSDEGTGP